MFRSVIREKIAWFIVRCSKSDYEVVFVLQLPVVNITHF